LPLTVLALTVGLVALIVGPIDQRKCLRWS
jgi:hypothetical protein